MTSVDIWRATEALEAQGWNEQAIADALALPVRTVKRLKLLAHLHPAMLDLMAPGNMPNEDQLRTIAAATLEEQAQVWKKHKPKKGHEVCLARSRPRPVQAPHSGFAPPGSTPSRRTPTASSGKTTCSRQRTRTAATPPMSRASSRAQQEWLQPTCRRRHAAAGERIRPPELPKKAESVYGKPGKGDLIGHYLDARSGEVKTVTYRLPEPKKTAKPGEGATPDAGDDRQRGDAAQNGPTGSDAEGPRDDRRSAHRRVAPGAEGSRDRRRP